MTRPNATPKLRKSIVLRHHLEYSESTPLFLKIFFSSSVLQSFFHIFGCFFTHFTSVLTKWIVLEMVLVIINKPKGLGQEYKWQKVLESMLLRLLMEDISPKWQKTQFRSNFPVKRQHLLKILHFFHFLSKQEQFISTFSVILIISTFFRPRGLVIGMKNRF